MTHQNIDINISKDREAMLDVVKKFSMDVMRPPESNWIKCPILKT